jgi:hypothetical protein
MHGIVLDALVTAATAAVHEARSAQWPEDVVVSAAVLVAAQDTATAATSALEAELAAVKLRDPEAEDQAREAIWEVLKLAAEALGDARRDVWPHGADERAAAVAAFLAEFIEHDALQDEYISAALDAAWPRSSAAENVARATRA